MKSPFLIILMLCFLFVPTIQAQENIETLEQKIKQQIGRIPGWCSREKGLEMFRLIIAEKPAVCVEIGVFGGSSIFPTALALQYNGQGLVYAIDPWENSECLLHYDDPNDANHVWWSKINLEKIYRCYLHMLQQYNLEPYVVTLKETSETALGKIGVIDILHVDGNHSEESSYYDDVAYLPKVRSGGYIWFDDAGWSTTHKALDYVKNTCELVKTVDQGNCLLFRKP